MTDFLEELLKQQGEEEERELRIANHKTVRAVRLRGDQTVRFPTISDDPASADPAQQIAFVRQRATILHSAQTNDAAAAANTEKTPEYLWDRYRRTHLAARTWQERIVRSAGDGFGTAGQEGGAPYGWDKQEKSSPGYAALVDAAFARDARRYDGPLRIL